MIAGLVMTFSLIFGVAEEFHRSEIKVAVAPYPPFAFTDENDVWGLEADIVYSIAEKMNAKVRWIITNFQSLIPLASEGKVDVSVGAIYITKERKKLVNFSQPYAITGLIIAKKSSLKCHSQTVECIRNSRVGVKKNATGEKIANHLKNTLGIEVVSFKTTEESFNALLQGDVDFVFNDYLNTLWYIIVRAPGQIDIVGEPYFLTKDKIGIVVNPKDKELLNYINDTLSSMKKTGELDSLYQRWFIIKTPIYYEEREKHLKIIYQIIIFIILIAVLSIICVKLSKSKKKMERIVMGSIMALSDAIETRDSFTRGHSEKVARLASALAEALGWSKKDIKKMFLAGLLHDVGKVGIPDSILLKPESLSTEEMEVMKKHADFSALIVDEITELKDIVPWVGFHHERWDGSGYPYGLKGSEIPLGAQILAIADVYATLTSGTPHSSPLSKEEALKIIEEGKGELWSPELAEKAIEVFSQIELKEMESFVPEEVEKIRKEFFFTDFSTGLRNHIYARLRFKEIADQNKEFTIAVVSFNDKREVVIRAGKDEIVRRIKILGESMKKNIPQLDFVALTEWGDIIALSMAGEKEVKLGFELAWRSFLSEIKSPAKVSLGISSFPKDGLSLDQLIKSAYSSMKQFDETSMRM